MCVCVCVCDRAGKERKKPDRVVLDCQERAYWIVNRPPVSVFYTVFILYVSTVSDEHKGHDPNEFSSAISVLADCGLIILTVYFL